MLPYPLNEQERDVVMKVSDDHFYPMLEALGAELTAKADAA